MMTTRQCAFFRLIIALVTLLTFVKTTKGMSNDVTPAKRTVAVIGTTGRLGRQVVMRLSSLGVPTRCLLRHDLSSIKNRSSRPLSLEPGMDSVAVASYLASLPNVEMVQGDVTDKESVQTLLKNCTACLAVHGARRISKATDILPWSKAEEDPNHPKQVNYLGVQNIIDAAKLSMSCTRVVRITGTQSTRSLPAVLINALGSFAKAWNYEGEELLRRQKDVDYTIIRPGVMSQPDSLPTGKVLALADNGNDLPVTPIRHSDIADLCIECLNYPNAARTTLSAMKVKDGEGEETYGPLLEKVKPDMSDFPFSLMDENKKVVRNGLLVFSAVVVALLSALFKSLSWVMAFAR